MRKIFLILALLLYSNSSRAQILNMSVNFAPLQLSEKFLQNLSECNIYAEEQSSELDGIKVKTSYMIGGLKNGICSLTVVGESNTDVKITQTCSLTAEQARDYATHLRKYQIHKYSPRFDKQRIPADKDYQAALQIMTNSNLCRIMRDKVDTTKDIRDNLGKCQKAQTLQILPDLQITRKIVGNEDNLCRYDFQVIRSNPDVRELIKIMNNKNANELKNIVKIQFYFSCSFDDSKVYEYLDILENQIVPEEEGLDFSAVQRPDYSEEMTFIMNNCELIKK